MSLTANRSSITVIDAPPPEKEETVEPPTTGFSYVQDAYRYGKSKSMYKVLWRSYLDTVPATQLLDALGANLNPASGKGTTNWIKQSCALLADCGVKRLRFEVGWASLEYANPTKLKTSVREELEEKIAAIREFGQRPLVLINANHGSPCPNISTNLTLVSAAKAGDKTIKVDPAGLGGVTIGKTGFGPTGQPLCKYLFTKAEVDGTLFLSQPIGATESYATGALPRCFTLKYTPFLAPLNQDGVTPNPAFEETMLGWLSYVGAVCTAVKELLESEDFDIELWNELSFGSQFRNINNYYEPDFDAGTGTGQRDHQIVTRTVAYLRKTLGMSEIGISNGFVNQNNDIWGGPGLTANNKHSYPYDHLFPAEDQEFGVPMLDAENAIASIKAGSEYTDVFVPTFHQRHPEDRFTNTKLEHYVYWLAPYEGFWSQAVGRNVPPHEPLPQDTSGGLKPSGYFGVKADQQSSSVPQLWITETGQGSLGKYDKAITFDQKKFVVAKAALRNYAMYVNKGVRALYLYASGEGKSDADFWMIPKSFFDAVTADPAHGYPGSAQGGAIMTAIKRFADAFAGATELGKLGSLTLDDLVDYAGNTQFEGNPKLDGKTEYPVGSGLTPYFPDFKNKDIPAFLPFQVNDTRKFVVAFYVATYDATKRYREGTDVDAYRMPDEKYRMTIGGVKGSGAIVSAIDPITGAKVAVSTISGSAKQLAVEVNATDYPRLLTIEETT
jgi:hypothetical protein